MVGHAALVCNPGSVSAVLGIGFSRIISKPADVLQEAIMKRLILLLLMAFSVKTTGAEKRALARDDLYRLKSLGDLVL